MNQRAKSVLLALNDVDRQLVILGEERQKIEMRGAALKSELDRRREILAQISSQKEACLAALSEAEQKKQQEEQRIIERRKQLSSIGGAKAAKIVERELDISTRSIQVLDESVIKARRELDVAQQKHARVEEVVAELEAKIAEETSGHESRLKELENDSGGFENESAEYASQLEEIDDRLTALYLKVKTRYPGDSVALAQDGACRSCYRSLPNQLYNQALAGNTHLQCPGCSRIIIVHSVEDESKSE